MLPNNPINTDNPWREIVALLLKGACEYWVTTGRSKLDCLTSVILVSIREATRTCNNDDKCENNRLSASCADIPWHIALQNAKVHSCDRSDAKAPIELVLALLYFWRNTQHMYVGSMRLQTIIFLPSARRSTYMCQIVIDNTWKPWKRARIA